MIIASIEVGKILNLIENLVIFMAFFILRDIHVTSAREF